ncbi:MAG: hypothetical protein U5R48_11515 [Gammaproteobacteria bacterium]|nr:hypothetical protein [Gammaproteobacteria bacterium]
MSKETGGVPESVSKVEESRIARARDPGGRSAGRSARVLKIGVAALPDPRR